MTSPSLPPLIWEPAVSSTSKPPSIFRTALSDEEYEEAKALARERSEEVKALYQKFGEKLTVYPQFSQFVVKNDPRIHRVVHLTYRVGKKDLSYPRPMVDLTTRGVSTPAAESFPKPRRPR